MGVSPQGGTVLEDDDLTWTVDGMRPDIRQDASMDSTACLTCGLSAVDDG
jgi:hypothetical protein